jgi:hypothetical protein
MPRAALLALAGVVSCSLFGLVAWLAYLFFCYALVKHHGGVDTLASAAELPKPFCLRLPTIGTAYQRLRGVLGGSQQEG